MRNDVANLYVGNGSTLVATATYDATPTINETACIGPAMPSTSRSPRARR